MIVTLGIDASSHTGYSLFHDNNLQEYGELNISCSDHSWPWGIHAWAKKISEAIIGLILKYNPDKIIIERANSSRFRDSQNLLDFMHAYLIEEFVDRGLTKKVSYVDSSEWRRLCGIKLNSQQKKQNKMARAASKNKEILKIDGKRAGVVGKKHLAVIKTNELFNKSFKLKDNNICEAILLAYSQLNK